MTLDDGQGGAAPPDAEPGAGPIEGPAERAEWALVEVFGRRQHAGRIREVERFGARFVQVDVPVDGDPATKGWTTHLYAGSAIFSITRIDEVKAFRINRPFDSLARYALPSRDSEEQDD